MNKWQLSHLLQMRGLKHAHEYKPQPIFRRIFYRCVDWNKIRELYRPFTGSRIFYRCVDWNALGGSENEIALVASFTDAWIETNGSIFPNRATMSHLLQMRGLKRWRSFGIFRHAVSHLLQMRGLKQKGKHIQVRRTRRIFYRCVDWNISRRCLQYFRQSHLLQMRGLKPLVSDTPKIGVCRIFYRCVDWNMWETIVRTGLYVASFTDAWIETLVFK